MIVISVILTIVGILLTVYAMSTIRTYDELIKQNDEFKQMLIEFNGQHLDAVWQMAREKSEALEKIQQLQLDNEKMRYVLEQQRNVKGENENERSR